MFVLKDNAVAWEDIQSIFCQVIVYLAKIFCFSVFMDRMLMHGPKTLILWIICCCSCTQFLFLLKKNWCISKPTFWCRRVFNFFKVIVVLQRFLFSSNVFLFILWCTLIFLHLYDFIFVLLLLNIYLCTLSDVFCSTVVVFKCALLSLTLNLTLTFLSLVILFLW